MNVSKLLEKMRSKGIVIRANNGYLCANSTNLLTEKQLKYLKQHKIEILEYLAHLEAANQSKKDMATGSR